VCVYLWQKGFESDETLNPRGVCVYLWQKGCVYLTQKGCV